jgi:purine-binding chemotaxis protein CheW
MINTTLYSLEVGMSEEEIKLPAFGLAEDMIAQLEEMLAKKKQAAGDPQAVAGSKPPTPNNLPVKAESPTRILDFAALFDESTGLSPEKRREKELQMVSFWLERDEFALGIQYVREIIRVTTITRIPEAPEHVKGVSNLRGRIIPIIDLRSRLGMPTTPTTKESRIIVVEAYQKMIGLLVDRVTQIIKIVESALSTPPEEVKPPLSDYLSSVVQLEDRLVLLLDAEKVLLLPGRK